MLTLLQAVVLFATTNIDHLVILSMWFARGHGRPGTTRRILAGQYLGFGAIIILTLALAAGINLVLPVEALRWLGLIPLIIGLKAAWQAWKSRGEDEDDDELIQGKLTSVLSVAAVTFANSGDEAAVYLPVFSVSQPWQLAVYVVVFLLLAAVVVFLAKYITSRKAIAEYLEKWESILFPVVMIVLGLMILILA
ncbi:cadmium resistance transporter [Propionimicrobium lymphophilum]|uniref:cadmium resistance transporter n=1 Tax=Propionimicrobium lymphophilum TaxID=33012 RepID=UPI0003FB34C9|nr:cadmium resistance transporter [Propionimicrobium lymphophilum]